MKAPTPKSTSRRSFLAGAAGLGAMSIAAPALAQMGQTSTEFERDLGSSQRRNVSSFRSLQWQDYFEDTRNGAILVDITSRALHFWSADQSVYRLYPTSVPLTEDLTRRGRTQVVDKVVNPPWRPTPAMRERNPEWPEFVPGGDPTNPLGVRALYLSWQFYRIHGTHDTRKIGRRSSNGCVGLYNEHILELFDMAEIAYLTTPALRGRCPSMPQLQASGDSGYSVTRGFECERRASSPSTMSGATMESENMKKFALAAALSLAATTSFAGGMAEPVMEEEVVVEEAAGTSGGMLVPLLLLVLIAAAVSGGSNS
jgi:L,D-transpeptidase ErfK/SrfK